MAALVNLPDFIKGDQWEGLTCGPVLVDGVAPAETLARVKMSFRDVNGILGYVLDSEVVSGAGLIVISNATTWTVSIGEQALPLEEGKWDYNLKFYRTGVTLPWTLLEGSITVKKGVPYDD